MVPKEGKELNRVIKFRAWDKENKRMKVVSELDFIYAKSERMDWGMQGALNDVWLNDEDTNYIPIDTILLQFTGLKDDNGAEIYEGYILSVINPNGEVDKLCVVEWDNHAGAYAYEPEGGYGDFDITSIGWAMSLGFKFTVIGNIYENPELLSGESDV
jgi:uncharacterized phage protein (TIGR01671 family)